METLVVDGMAIVHNMHSSLSSLNALPNLKQYVSAQLEWLGSGMWYEPLQSVPLNVIWCWDSKPYWRSAYLLRDDVWQRITPTFRRKPVAPSPIHYKGGRNRPTQLLTVLKSYTRQAVRAKAFHMLELKTSDYGFEADDMAALVVQVNRTSEQPHHINLLSRDKDWLGLLGPEVTWLNPNCDNPRVRTLENYESTFDTSFGKPSDIWAYKSLTGDASDNLPNCRGDAESAAALLPVISLFEPPDEYNLMHNPEMVSRARKVLSVVSKQCDNVEKAMQALRKAGLEACVPYIH